MSKLIAFCGLSCTDCPAYLAGGRFSEEDRVKTAAEWSTDSFPLTATDIDCHGCIGADDQLVSFCRACDIRKCGVEKNVDICADCREYPCEKLEKTPTEAKAMLAELRQ